MNLIVETTFLWVSMTPRGSLVLPDVYWRKARSSSRAGVAAGAAPSTSRSGGSRIARTHGASEALWSTPLLNQPMVATAVASESTKRLAVPSTPSVG